MLKFELLSLIERFLNKLYMPLIQHLHQSLVKQQPWPLLQHIFKFDLSVFEGVVEEVVVVQYCHEIVINFVIG